MMFFSQQKKIQRDRSLGLVFQWRGGYKGNTGGLTLAVIMATALFLVGFTLFKVYVKTAAAPSRFRAEVTHISDVNEDLRWLLERKAPHLASWRTVNTSDSLMGVDEKIYASIESRHKPSMRWKSLPKEIATQSQLQLQQQPQLSFNDRVILPSVSRHRSSESKSNNKVRFDGLELIIGSSDAAMQARFPQMKSYVTRQSGLERYLGRTISYTVTLSKNGEVISCLPAEWNTDGEILAIERWIYTLEFGRIEGEKQQHHGVGAYAMSVTLQERRADD